MKKKWLALFLAIGTVFSSFACLTACDEKRGEEVTAEEWDAAFAYPNTENMIIERTRERHVSEEIMTEITRWVFNETEAYGKMEDVAQSWDESTMEWKKSEWILENAYKAVEDMLFSYSTIPQGLNEEGEQWKLKKKLGGQEEFKKWKSEVFESEYLLYDVYCLGIDMFTYDEEQGFYYKDWTVEKEGVIMDFRQEAIFKGGKLYEICTTLKTEVDTQDGKGNTENIIKITFESEEIILPNEGELLGAILAAKKNEEK